MLLGVHSGNKKYSTKPFKKTTLPSLLDEHREKKQHANKGLSNFPRRKKDSHFKLRGSKVYGYLGEISLTNPKVWVI